MQGPRIGDAEAVQGAEDAEIKPEALSLQRGTAREHGAEG